MNFTRIATGSATLAAVLTALSAQYAGAAPAPVATNVNLRQGPGTTYTIITTIPSGATVDVAGCSGAWCQVTFQDQYGYVIASSLGQGEAGVQPPPGDDSDAPVAVNPGPPPPGYGPPPPGYGPPPPGYGPPLGYYYVAPPPYGYYGYGPGPYWGGGWYGRYRW